MTSLSHWRPASWSRVIFTLLLALTAALLCVWLRTPIPWMIGPLLATALFSALGARTEGWTPLRDGGQTVIGSALGLYFTPAVGALVISLWWSIAVGVIMALLLGLGCGAWLRRVNARQLSHLTPAQLNSTTYFAGAIGGASEMTLIAERRGARTDLVAATHSLRVLLVTVTIPFALQLWGVTGLDTFTPGLREVSLPGFALLMGLCLLSAWTMERLGRANAWFMGALVVTMVLTLCGVSLSAIPQVVLNGAQLVIGVSLGVRFTPAFVHTAPRWLGSVAVATFVMMLLCAAGGWILAQLMDVHPATMLLGMSPGGIAEMAITAKVLQLGVPVVTVFQVCRLVTVLVLVEPMYRWLYERP